jgi:hypothetical protein
MTNTVTNLDYDQTLSIVKGDEKITWKKLRDDRSVFKFRRYHFKAGKLLRVMDNKKLGTSENDELEFRLDTGWKRL